MHVRSIYTKVGPCLQFQRCSIHAESEASNDVLPEFTCILAGGLPWTCRCSCLEFEQNNQSTRSISQWCWLMNYQFGSFVVSSFSSFIMNHSHGDRLQKGIFSTIIQYIICHMSVINMVVLWLLYDDYTTKIVILCISRIKNYFN